jgi:hypothetical protein
MGAAHIIYNLYFIYFMIAAHVENLHYVVGGGNVIKIVWVVGV